MNNKVVTVTILGFMLVAAVFMPLQSVFAQSGLGVDIIQVDPSSLTGPVGTNVNVQGTIYTPNSSFQIVFARQVVASGISEGYYVNTNFTVPEVAAGSYTMTLRDVKININATQQFAVTTGYLMQVSPQTAQEGNSISITVKVAAAIAGTSYSASLTVALPSSAGTQFTKTVQLGTPDSKGTASAQVTFPDSSFSPNGSLTDYAGTYKVSFNGSLAQTQFTVGFMSSTAVHRGDSISIHATGYQSGETATISASSSKTGSSFPSQEVTASTDGVISASVVVPSGVAIGDYTMTISGQKTSKAVKDSQAFSVVGYTVKVLTVNLAGEVVPQINVQVTDPTSGQTSNSTSGDDGIALFKLEKGNHVFTPFWNGVNVGAQNLTVTGDSTITLHCQLTDLKVTVRNTNGVAMPFVNIDIFYQYQAGGLKSGSSSGQTGPMGSFTFNSTLAGARYTINASMYGQVFNQFNNSLSNLPLQATFEFVVTCPSENMTLNVVGYNQEAIPNARIELIELTNGLFNSATTDSSGAVNTQVTFGTYHAKVYKDNILINETDIQAFSSSQKQIRCTLYGIQVTVSVVDFFGSPIPNANVTLNGPATEKLTATTQGDGKVTFTNVIGGDMQIIASTPGVDDGYQALTLTVNQPTSVQVKIDKYVSIGGLLIQASTLLTIAIILVAVILLVLVELFIRRRRKRPVKAEVLPP